MVVLELRINLWKSKLIPLGIWGIQFLFLAANLCCRVVGLPTSYLGLPLGVKYKSKIN